MPVQKGAGDISWLETTEISEGMLTLKKNSPSKNMSLVVDIIFISSLIQLGVMGSKYKGKERMLARI